MNPPLHNCHLTRSYCRWGLLVLYLRAWNCCRWPLYGGMGQRAQNPCATHAEWDTWKVPNANEPGKLRDSLSQGNFEPNQDKHGYKSILPNHFWLQSNLLQIHLLRKIWWTCLMWSKVWQVVAYHKLQVLAVTQALNFIFCSSKIVDLLDLLLR